MFQNYIDTILSSWHALQFAVQQRTGGPESLAISKWMNGETEQFFRDNSELYPDEVAEFLSTIMNQELNTLVEDGSDLEISEILCKVYEYDKEGNVESIENILSKLPSNNNIECKVQSESDGEEEMQASQVSSQISCMNISDDIPTLESTPLEVHSSAEVEDGWVMVKKGKNRKNR